MKKQLITLAVFLLSLSAFGQFRLASDGFVTQLSNPNDSTYIVSVKFFADLTGSGYLPLNIQVGYRIFSQRGQLYRVSAADDLTFSSATLTLVEVDNAQVDTEGLPIGQVQVYNPGSVEAVPQVPYGTTGATAVLQAAVVSYNSTLPGGSEAGGGAAYVADYTALAAFTGEQSIVVVGDELTGGTFVADAGATVVDGGIVPVTGWRRQFEGGVNVNWYGAIPNDSITDEAGILAADAYALNNGMALIFGAGDYLMSDITLTAKEVTSDGATLKPDSNGFDYIAIIQSKYIHDINFDASGTEGGTGQHKNVDFSNNDEIVRINNVVSTGAGNYGGGTSVNFLVKCVKGFELTNVTFIESDYADISYVHGEGQYLISNVISIDRFQRTVVAIGQTYTTQDSRLAGVDTVTVSTKPYEGAAIIIDDGVNEHSYAILDWVRSGSNYKIVLSRGLDFDAPLGTQYITEMGTTSISNYSARSEIEDASQLSGFVIGPANSLIRSISFNNVKVSGYANETLLKTKDSRYISITGCSFDLLDYERIGAANPYAATLENVTRSPPDNFKPEYKISNTFFGGRVLMPFGENATLNASNSTFSVEGMTNDAFNISVNGGGDVTLNNCNLLGADLYAIEPGNVNNLLLKIKLVDVTFIGDGDPWLFRFEPGQVELIRLNNPNRHKLSSLESLTFNFNKGGKGRGVDGWRDSGIDKILTKQGVPTTGAHGLGEISLNLDYDGSLTSPIHYRCIASGTPGTWIPVYLNYYDDLFVGGNLDVGSDIFVGANNAGHLLRDAGGGLIVKPGFNIAGGNPAVAFQQFDGDVAFYFTDNDLTYFNDVVNFNGGFTFVGGTASMGSNKLQSLADGTATTDAATFGQVQNATGWAEYRDNGYTVGAPFQLVANVKRTLPNNSATVIHSQKPTDITEFYTAADSTITGRNGDGVTILVEFTAKPTSVAATFVDVSIDIGGAIGEIYPRTLGFPKGANVERNVIYHVTGYTLNTWEANGGKVKVVSDGPVDIYNIRHVITRTHKAR